MSGSCEKGAVGRGEERGKAELTTVKLQVIVFVFYVLLGLIRHG